MRLRHAAMMAVTLGLQACATEPVIWTDLTGQSRDNGQLQMASGQCEMVSQQVGIQIYSGLPSAGTCTSCAFAAAAAVMQSKQNAYDNCMRAKGWASQ